jgi:hypothetical protein
MRGLVAATMMAAGLGACLAPAGSLPTQVR